MQRVIFHLDLDSFFVSAERLRNASLKDRPVAVGGDGPRAVISSASYEARKFGVRSAMPTARALRLCPTLVLVPPDFTLYSSLSRQVFEILDSFSPVVERASIDEGYLDMTGTTALFGPPDTAAQAIRAKVKEVTGLTCSIGIAPNRLVAKIASDFCKPDNLFEVKPGTEAAFLAPLGVERLPGCGKVTQGWLKDREIKTLGQLQRYPLDVLEKHLGKFGTFLHDGAWGRGSTEFHEEAKTRSISREQTFSEDVDDVEELRRIIRLMAAELAQELRSDGDFARAIRLKLRYPPFETVTRSRVLDCPTQSDKPLGEALCELFDEHWEPHAPLRLIGVGCVLGSGERQLGLFENLSQERKEDTLDRLKDQLRSKFGQDIVR